MCFYFAICTTRFYSLLPLPIYCDCEALEIFSLSTVFSSCSLAISSSRRCFLVCVYVCCVLEEGKIRQVRQSSDETNDDVKTSRACRHLPPLSCLPALHPSPHPSRSPHPLNPTYLQLLHLGLKLHLLQAHVKVRLFLPVFACLLPLTLLDELLFLFVVCGKNRCQ